MILLLREILIIADGTSLGQESNLGPTDFSYASIRDIMPLSVFLNLTYQQGVVVLRVWSSKKKLKH